MYVIFMIIKCGCFSFTIDKYWIYFYIKLLDKNIIHIFLVSQAASEKESNEDIQVVTSQKKNNAVAEYFSLNTNIGCFV